MYIYPNNISNIPDVQYGSRAARVAWRGGQEKGTIVTAYVLYCSDARGVIAVRYCYNLGSFLCIVVVLM